MFDLSPKAITLVTISSKNSVDLDLGRKLNLVEAMLNADSADPQAQRLGFRVTFSRAGTEHGYLEIEQNDLWLSFSESDALRMRVTDDRVSDIIALIERDRSGE